MRAPLASVFAALVLTACSAYSETPAPAAAPEQISAARVQSVSAPGVQLDQRGAAILILAQLIVQKQQAARACAASRAARSGKDACAASPQA